MRTFLSNFSFLILALTTSVSHAQTPIIPVTNPNSQTNTSMGPGLNNLAGNYANSTTTLGALTNRKTADSLYQQALADEKAAWSSFPPSVGLLTKALKEAQDGVKADDQSHSMAQEAMHSAETLSNSSPQTLKDYGAMSTDEISKMATTSSSLWPQVAAKLQGYGMSLTEDKQLMKTPFGSFSTSSDESAMAAAIKKIAPFFGVSGGEVDKAIAAAQATADAIGKKALADAQQKLKANAVADGKNSDDKNAAGDGKDGKDADGKGRKVAGEKELVSDPDKNGIDWDQRARELNAYRSQLQDQMGLEPIWGKDDDIFKKIHEHYVILDKQNTFLPASAKQMVAATTPR